MPASGYVATKTIKITTGRNCAKLETLVRGRIEIILAMAQCGVGPTFVLFTKVALTPDRNRWHDFPK